MTVKIAHLSDLHIDERGRLNDLALVLDAVIEGAKEEKVDLVLIAGDFFERRSTPKERSFLASFLRRIAEVAPVWGCRGNHDAPGDLAIFNLLDTEHPIWIEERATSAPGSAPIWHLDDDRKVGLLAMAWIDKANIAAQIDADIGSEQSRQDAIEATKSLLACLGAEANRLRSMDAVPVMVAHAMLGGSVVSTGQILIGQGIELSPSDLLDVGASYVGVGHIHKEQDFFEGRVAYAGSPTRQNFGETEDKGWRLITLTDDGELVSNEFLELPAREIVLLETDWFTDTGAAKLRDVGIDVCFALSEREKVNGALVRFRYRVRAEDVHLVDEEAIEKIFLADGAEEVTLEGIITHEARARAPEIVDVRSTSEKIDTFFRAKGIEVDEAQRGRLKLKLSELEGEEVAHAAV